MIGNKGGMVVLIERLVQLLITRIADEVQSQKEYASYRTGCPAEQDALRAVEDALRNVDVPFMMKELMEVKNEDHPQPD